MNLSDSEFEALIAKAMDELPQEYIKNLDNVAIVFAEHPTQEQLKQQGVRTGSLLLGLYEGTPLIQRYSSGYSGVLPDKITLFKLPLLRISNSQDALFAQIKRTLWHEIAHHYGLDHRHIASLESGQNETT